MRPGYAYSSFFFGRWANHSKEPIDSRPEKGRSKSFFPSVDGSSFNFFLAQSFSAVSNDHPMIKNIRLTHPLNDRYGIDLTKPVKLYRNLREKCWSIQQDGLVKAHCDRAWLSNCRFHVSENGRQKVLRERKKYVHAYVIGHMFGWPIDSKDFPARYPISYNPFKGPNFVTHNGEPVKRAKYVKADINAVDHITASA